MSVQLGIVPVITRPGVGVVLVSRWRVGTPERQRTAVDTIARGWQSREWPDAGPLSYSVFMDNDGTALLHYSQWRDREVHRAYSRTSRDERVAEVDAAVPGIERSGLTAYELYRSAAPATGRAGVPGCVVTVEVEFEGPDAARARHWADTVVEAQATDPIMRSSDPALPTGGISAHFHVAIDGTRVLNYAEWESEAAHIAALEAPGNGIGSPTEQWQRVFDHPGVQGGTVTRHTPAISLSA
jgi:hypothetical protein